MHRSLKNSQQVGAQKRDFGWNFRFFHKKFSNFIDEKFKVKTKPRRKEEDA